MFRYSRPARAARGVTVTPDHIACDAVCDAEDIVRRAWEAVLLDRAQRMESAVQAARDNRQAADRLATEAQRGGDPGEMSATYANLREAVEVARRTSSAAQRIRPRLLAELDLLARTAKDHAHGPLADQPAPAAVRMTAQPAEPAALPAPAPRSAPPSLLHRGPARWIRGLLNARTAARRWP
jgi:hypothetical protein